MCVNPSVAFSLTISLFELNLYQTSPCTIIFTIAFFLLLFLGVAVNFDICTNATIRVNNSFEISLFTNHQPNANVMRNCSCLLAVNKLYYVAHVNMTLSRESDYSDCATLSATALFLNGTVAEVVYEKALFNEGLKLNETFLILDKSRLNLATFSSCSPRYHLSLPERKFHTLIDLSWSRESVSGRGLIRWIGRAVTTPQTDRLLLGMNSETRQCILRNLSPVL